MIDFLCFYLYNKHTLKIFKVKRGNIMFTYIKLKNYKSFDDITIDLSDKNGNPKKLVIIYGENAAGKTKTTSRCIRRTVL